MAKLYFYYGAMGSTKTITAITTVYNYRERGQNPLFLKTSTDTRDGKFIVRSRIGLEAECMLLEQLSEMSDDEIRKYDVLVVDEVQFATVEQIDMLADIVDIYNIPVLCYGLRADFQLNFFEGSGRLMAIADEIKEIKTMCWCGRKATCNARYDANGIIYDGEQVVLGANHNYIPLCRKHYKMGKMNNELLLKEDDITEFKGQIIDILENACDFLKLEIKTSEKFDENVCISGFAYNVIADTIGEIIDTYNLRMEPFAKKSFMTNAVIGIIQSFRSVLKNDEKLGIMDIHYIEQNIINTFVNWKIYRE